MFPAILGLLTPLLGKVLDRIPNAAEREKAKLEFELELQKQETALLEIISKSDAAQVEINKVEAASPNWFIAAARPFIMWVCGLAFAWSYLVQPILIFGMAASGRPLKDLPALNMGEMMPVLLGLLGLGGMRSWEKYVGVNDKH